MSEYDWRDLARAMRDGDRAAADAGVLDVGSLAGEVAREVCPDCGGEGGECDTCGGTGRKVEIPKVAAVQAFADTNGRAPT